MVHGGAVGRQMLDIRITNPVTAEVERGTYVEEGQGARESEAEKIRKFKIPCESANIEFIPMVLESFGRWGSCLTKFFNQAISAAADNKKIDISFVKNYWERRISMSLQKGEADAVNARIFRLLAGRESEMDEASDPSTVQRQSYSCSAAGMFGP